MQEDEKIAVKKQRVAQSVTSRVTAIHLLIVNENITRLCHALCVFACF